MCYFPFYPKLGQYLFEGTNSSEVDEIINACEFILADRDSNFVYPEPPMFKPDYDYSNNDVETKLWRAEITERYGICMKCSYQIHRLEREKLSKIMSCIDSDIDTV